MVKMALVEGLRRPDQLRFPLFEPCEHWVAYAQLTRTSGAVNAGVGRGAQDSVPRAGIAMPESGQMQQGRSVAGVTGQAGLGSDHQALQITICEKLELAWEGGVVDGDFLEATLRRCLTGAKTDRLHIDARYRGLTMLHWSVLADQVSVIDALAADDDHLVDWDILTRSADMFGATTALCLAAVLDRQEAVGSLLRAGASPVVAWQQLDPDQKSAALVGLTPLHLVNGTASVNWNVCHCCGVLCLVSRLRGKGLQ